MNRRGFLAAFLASLGAWGFGRWLPASAAPAATGPALLAQGIHYPVKAQVAWVLHSVEVAGVREVFDRPVVSLRAEPRLTALYFDPLTGQARRIG